MRLTILPYAIILTKAQRAKESIVACVLPLRCFIFLVPNYTIFQIHKVFARQYNRTSIRLRIWYSIMHSEGSTFNFNVPQLLQMTILKILVHLSLSQRCIR